MLKISTKVQIPTSDRLKRTTSIQECLVILGADQREVYSENRNRKVKIKGKGAFWNRYNHDYAMVRHWVEGLWDLFAAKYHPDKWPQDKSLYYTRVFQIGQEAYFKAIKIIDYKQYPTGH